MLDFFSSLLSEFIRRIDYSFTNMNMTQWAIFATVCLVIGVIAIKAKITC